MSVEEPDAVPLICWEAVATNLYRVSVPGGWLYSCPGGEHGPDTVAFVSDPESTPPLAVHDRRLDELERRSDADIKRVGAVEQALVTQLTTLVGHENRLHALEALRAEDDRARRDFRRRLEQMAEGEAGEHPLEEEKARNRRCAAPSVADPDRDGEPLCPAGCGHALSLHHHVAGALLPDYYCQANVDACRCYLPPSYVQAAK